MGSDVGSKLGSEKIHRNIKRADENNGLFVGDCLSSLLLRHCTAYEAVRSEMLGQTEDLETQAMLLCTAGLR
jgi:hypothetical protein